MANYSTPWGSDDPDIRFPELEEYQKGFLCGRADAHLFNGMWYAIMSELKAIMDAGGIVTQSDADFTQVLQAINNLIAAATGGTPSDYILESQARARLPIYPEIISADGRLNVYAPSTGTVRIPNNVSFLHRGIGLEVTPETDFATTLSKTYHVRWSYAGGYALKDLADVTYNGASDPETDEKFDSTYDDMLIARVTTNSSNVATITNLANKARLTLNSNITGTNFDRPAQNLSSCQLSCPINWARTPTGRALTIVNFGYNNPAGSNHDRDRAMFDYNVNASTIGAGATALVYMPANRYVSQFRYMSDIMNSLIMQFNFTA